MPENPHTTRTVLIGGKRRGLTYIQRIEARANELRELARPRKQKELKPGEENQLRLPGL